MHKRRIERKTHWKFVGFEMSSFLIFFFLSTFFFPKSPPPPFESPPPLFIVAAGYATVTPDEAKGDWPIG